MEQEGRAGIEDAQEQAGVTQERLDVLRETLAGGVFGTVTPIVNRRPPDGVARGC